jgi:hypothetical protein
VTVSRADGGLTLHLQASADPDLELWAATRLAPPLAKALGVPVQFAHPRPAPRRRRRVEPRAVRSA